MGSICGGGNTVTKSQSESYQANPETIAFANYLQGQYGNLPGPGAVPYQGIAALNPYQTSALDATFNYGMSNPALPYFNKASNLLDQGAAPINMEQVNDLATEFAAPNLKAYRDQMGALNTANNAGIIQAAGGVGAERLGVGEAEFARQAGLGAGQIQSKAQMDALQQMMTQKQLEQAAGSVYGSLAPSVLGTGLGAYGAALGAGGQYQQQMQNILNSLYNQQMGAYQNPFQVFGLGQGLLGGLSGALGGTKTGVSKTDYPPTSPLGGLAGLGLAGLGAYNTFGKPAARGGAVHMADGGMSNAPGMGDSFWDSLGAAPAQTPQSSKGVMGDIADMLNQGSKAGAFKGMGSLFGGGSGAAGEAAPLGLAGDMSGAEAGSGGLLSGIGDSLGSLFGAGAEGGGFLAGLGDVLGEALPFLFLKDGGPAPRAMGGSVNPFDAGRGFADDEDAGDIGPDSGGLIKGNLGDYKIVIHRPGEKPIEFPPATEDPTYAVPPPRTAAAAPPDEGGGGIGGISPGRPSGLPTPPDLAKYAAPAASAAMAQSPGMALMAAGLGMAAASGRRDQHGLPIGGSPLGQLVSAAGTGGLEGVKTLEQQRDADMRRRQLESQLAQHQYQMQMQGVPYTMMTKAQQATAAHQAEMERHQRAVEEQGNFVYYPGTSLGEDGQPVQGVWAYDKRRNIQTFTPNASIQSPSLGPVIIPGGTGSVPGTEASPVITGVDPKLPGSVAGMSGEAIALAGTNWANSGKLPPGVASSRSQIAIAQRNAIENYGAELIKSRGLTRQEASEMWLYRPRWAGWLMGADGRAAGALGTLVDHLDTARSLMKALHNGDMQLYNTVKNKFAEQFGQPAPTSVKAALPIIGAEVMKAIGVQGAGGENERSQAAKALGDLGLSPEQSDSAITAVQKLAAGQLRTKQRQAEAILLPEDKIKKLIGKRAWEVLSSLPPDEGAAAVPRAAPSGTPGTGGWR